MFLFGGVKNPNLFPKSFICISGEFVVFLQCHRVRSLSTTSSISFVEIRYILSQAKRCGNRSPLSKSNAGHKTGVFYFHPISLRISEQTRSKGSIGASHLGISSLIQPKTVTKLSCRQVR